MADLQISQAATRSMLLQQQGLLAPPKRAARKADVLASIRRMGQLQIDTIHVVARSPYLVLFSRLGAYDPAWVDGLLRSGALFEWWSHALCWLPREHWPLARGLMLHGMRERLRPWNHVLPWLEKHRAAADAVLAQIRERGPQRAADFEAPPGRDGPRVGVWWNWRQEKAALEFMYWTGELMIAGRDRFQRLYELRERVRPDWDDTAAVDAAAARRAQLRQAALALGPATLPWLHDYFRFRYRTESQATIRALQAEGELIEAQIEGVAGPAWLHRDLLPLLRKAEAGKLAPLRTALLSPFDPLVWDRRRNRELFGFDYTIEVYTPEHKRRYGYFVMPLLHRGRLIGRLDPKAHRKDGVFEVRALHLEPGVKPADVAWDEVATELQALAEWHQTPQVKVGKSDPPAAATKLKAALKAGKQ
jgi:uncharacterized protein YcaQ